MEEIKKILREQFPHFTSEDLISAMASSASLHTAEEEKEIMVPGAPIHFIPLVIRGAIKVLRPDPQGDELFLYYIYPGQTCAYSLRCCWVDSPGEVRAVAEAGTQYLSLPRQQVARWFDQYPEWNRFILDMYADRFEALIEAVDSIAFRQMDQRLLDYLRDKTVAMGNPELQITHQQIAQDLHSSREVISRLLKKLENSGDISMARNRIRLKGY